MLIDVRRHGATQSVTVSRNEENEQGRIDPFGARMFDVGLFVRGQSADRGQTEVEGEEDEASGCFAANVVDEERKSKE